MIDFLIALFGGAYYLGKSLNESSKNKNYERARKEWEKTRDEMVGKYCLSYMEEHELKNKILSGDIYDKICNEFKDDFEYVLGENWKQVLCLPKNRWDFIPQDKIEFSEDNHIYWVYHLLLASKGKVDRWTFAAGYRIWIPTTPLYIMQKKFIQCMENRLIKAGADIKFTEHDKQVLIEGSVFKR